MVRQFAVWQHVPLRNDQLCWSTSLYKQRLRAGVRHLNILAAS